MTELQMYRKSFKRPKNFFMLTEREQYDIDKELGILDWKGENLTPIQLYDFKKHYKNKTWA